MWDICFAGWQFVKKLGKHKILGVPELLNVNVSCLREKKQKQTTTHNNTQKNT